MAYIPLETQLKKLLKDPAAVRELKTESGKTAEEILISEARRLRKIIESEMLQSLPKYESSWYDRTGNFLRSLDDAVKIDRATNTIEINFDDDLAYHDSWITKQNPNYKRPGFVPLLMNEGFRILHSSKRFEPAHFIEEAISEFNREKPDWINVKVTKIFEGSKFFDDYM